MGVFNNGRNKKVSLDVGNSSAWNSRTVLK